MISSVENRVVAVPLIGDGFIAVLKDLVEIVLALEVSVRPRTKILCPGSSPTARGLELSIASSVR